MARCFFSNILLTTGSGYRGYLASCLFSKVDCQHDAGNPGAGWDRRGFQLSRIVLSRAAIRSRRPPRQGSYLQWDGAGAGRGGCAAAQRLSECVAVRFVPSGPAFGANPFGSRCERNIMRLIYSSLLQIVSPANKGCFFFLNLFVMSTAAATLVTDLWDKRGLGLIWMNSRQLFAEEEMWEAKMCLTISTTWIQIRVLKHRSRDEEVACRPSEVREYFNTLTQETHFSENLQNTIFQNSHANVTGPKPVSLALDYYLNSSCPVTFQRCHAPGPLGACSGAVPSGNLRVLISGATSCTAALRS